MRRFLQLAPFEWCLPSPNGKKLSNQRVFTPEVVVASSRCSLTQGWGTHIFENIEQVSKVQGAEYMNVPLMGKNYVLRNVALALLY